MPGNNARNAEMCVAAFVLGQICGFALANAAAVESTNYPPSPHITIGLLLPPDEPQAQSLRDGVLLGVADAAREESVRVTAVVRGAIGQWGADGVEAARMVTDDQAQGLIAPPGRAGSHLALQVAGRTAVPVVSLCADSSVTRTGVPWMVRITPTTQDEARSLLRGFDWAKRASAPKAWAALIPPGRNGSEVAHDLAAEAGALPPVFIPVDWPSTNLGALCRRAADAGKGGILVWLPPAPAGHVVRVLRECGFSGMLGGGSWLRCAEFVESAGISAEGFRVAAPMLGPVERIRHAQFAMRFRAQFGREPDDMAAMSYDAAQLLARLLHAAGEQPPNTMFPLHDVFPGVTGNMGFDKEGNRQASLDLLEVHDGRFVELK